MAEKQLKVAVLGTRGFPHVQGGVEKHCEELYPRLVDLGCDVTVFTRTPYIPEGQRQAAWKGVKFVHLWCPRKKSLEAILHTFYGILKARILSPDVLHIHSIGPSLLAPMARIMGMKVMMTHHGPDYQREKWGAAARLALRLGERMGVLYSNRVIAISKGIQQHAAKLFGKTASYIPNGVTVPQTTEPGAIVKQWVLEPGRYAFTACRFVPEKGLHDLIKSYGSIENPQFKLVIAGDADHETDYSRNLKKAAAETKGVVLTGFISGQPLAELFSNAAFFVLPSYYEGLPIALLEALSYGLPVAVSDIPQHREIPLADKRYFPVGDAAGMAEVMRAVFSTGISADEKESYDKLLRETYNWDRIAEQTIRVYEEVVRQ